MIDILLIIPSFKYSKLNETLSICPNLGLALIAANLEKFGYKVKVLDCSALNLNLQSINLFVKKEKPRIVGISASTIQLNESLRIAREVKEINPNIKTILGGAHSSTMKNDCVPAKIDFISFGEGDLTILQLADYIIKGIGTLEKINGLIYKKENRVFINKKTDKTVDLNKLPFPAYHLFSMDKYKPYATFDLGKKFCTVITSRGCSFSCSFCTSAAEFSGGWRGLDSKNMFALINMLNKKFNVEHIYFQDDEFTLNKNRIIKFCNFIIKNDLKIYWECLSRAPDITDNLAKLMKQAGCEGVLLGVETGYEYGLKKLNKQLSLNQVEEAFRILRENKIESRATFIMGFPWEEQKDIEKTIQFAKKIDPDIAYFQTLVPYEKTLLYKELEKEKLLKPVSNEQYIQHSILGSKPLIKTHKISSEELSKYVSKAFFKFYFRPKYILRRLFRMKNFPMMKRYLKVGVEVLFSFIFKK